MNKKLSVFVFGLILTLSIISFASASPIVDMINGVMDGTWEILKPILDILVGDTSTVRGSEFSPEDIFLIKLMFLAIIFAVSWKVLDIMPVLNERSWVPIAISVAISILSVRFINDGSTIAAMLFPYGVFGVALTSFLPFLIYFFATIRLQMTARKLAWMFFGVVYLFVYFARVDELGQYALMYLIIAVLSVVVILTDGTIQKFRAKNKIEKIHSVHNRKRAIALNEEREKMTERYHKNPDNYDPVYVPRTGNGRKDYHDDLAKVDRMIIDLEKGL